MPELVYRAAEMGTKPIKTVDFSTDYNPAWSLLLAMQRR
jgi:hypothetical protein